ncbi:hypothetical protein GJ496_008957 [Pomphorhynchus laevis]|nr:hypothetical protein GJ496_008957 [Pomphorhynchus laevis]
MRATDRCTVVLTLLAGSGFMEKPGYSISFSAKLNGEVMLSKSVPLVESPELCDEVGWEFSRRQFRKLRSNRAHLKLVLYESKSYKQEIGYIMIDLRSATEVPLPKWLELTKSIANKYKPLVKLTFHYEFKPEPAKHLKQKDQWIALSRKFKATQSGIIHVKDKNYLYLQPIHSINQDEECCETFFEINLEISSIKNIEQVTQLCSNISDSDDNLTLFCRLFDQKILSEPFKPDASNFTPESFTILLRASLLSLQNYLQRQNCFEIVLVHNRDDRPLAICNYSLQDQIDGIQEPIASNDILHKMFNLKFDFIDVSDDFMEFNSDATTLQGSFSIILSQSDLHSNDEEDYLTELCELENVLDQHSSNCSSEKLSTQDSITADPIMDDPDDIAVKMRFQIKLEIIKLLISDHSSSMKSIMLRYAYPFFGIEIPVSTGPIQLKSKPCEDCAYYYLKGSAGVFQFENTFPRLNQNLHKHPIVIEVVDISGEHAHQLIGKVSFPVWQILAQPLKASLNSSNCLKLMNVGIQTMTEDFSILSTNGSNQIIGMVTIKFDLENFGPLNVITDNVLPKSCNLTSNLSKNISEDLKYHASIEIQMYKEKAIKEFEESLRAKEITRLEELTSMFKEKAKEQEFQVMTKIQENCELNRKLKCELKNVDSREQALSLKEIQLKNIRAESSRRKDLRIMELEEKLKRVNSRLEEENNLTQFKIKEFRSQIEQQKSTINESEKKYRQKCSELEKMSQSDQRLAIMKLQNQLTVMRVEKDKSDTRLNELTEERNRYKLLWTKALKDYEHSREQELCQTRKQLELKNEELCKLKTQLSMKDEAFSCTDSKVKSVGKECNKSVPHPQQHPQSIVEQFQSHRMRLLTSGDVKSDDRVIAAIEREIHRQAHVQTRG